MEKNIDDLKAEVSKYEKRLKVAKEPDEISFAEKKLKSAKETLESALEKEKVSKKTPVKVEKKAKAVKKTSDKVSVVKVKKDKPVKSLRTIVHEGKTYTEKDKKFCEILLDQFAKRRLAQKVANKKHKTTSVSSKIGRDVALAMSAVIDNVPMEKIKKNPKEFFNKVKNVEKAGNDFIQALRAILGSDYDREDIKAELAPIKELVDKIKSRLDK